MILYIITKTYLKKYSTYCVNDIYTDEDIAEEACSKLNAGRLHLIKNDYEYSITVVQTKDSQ